MFEEIYRNKRMSPDNAAALVPEDASLTHGLAVCEPPAILEALGRRLRSGDLKHVSVYSMLPGRPVAESLLDPLLLDQVDAFSWFVGPADRGLVRTGLNYFIPNEFHQLPRFIREAMDLTVAVTTVSPMDRNGFFTFGLSNDYISAAARAAKVLIVEVNENMPRIFGDSLLHVSEVTAIVENSAPVPEIMPQPPRPEAEKIGKIVADLVPDEAVIQLGFGTLPAAVGKYLSGHRDLGIHTELFCPALMDLVRKGAATGAKKAFHRRKHCFTNALGNREMYDFLHDNPSAESYPVDYLNDPGVIARNPNMISINATIQVDLLGQCNSEYMAGSEYSGTGGQLDYVRGAYRSPGGKSVIAFYSTAKEGSVSRVVPRLPAGTVVTTPATDVHYLATEYGAVNLKGKCTRDRALAIIAIAHPRFRDELLKEAENMRLI
ncbi:MAG: acetyl-CoA hydrolase/transferase C-terminal domain-containing protein [Thermodesulfobacteriota bacterium]